MDKRTRQLNTLKEMPPWDWPKDTTEFLHKILRNRPEASDADRIEAAHLAGNVVVINDEIANALISLVEDPDEAPLLRATSAIALGPVLDQCDTDGFEGGFDEPPISEDTFDHIRKVLRDTYRNEVSAPKEVRRRVLEAAVRAHQKWQIEAVREAYNKGDREWKMTAVFCMQWLDGFEKEIVESLSSSDAEIRMEAVSAAGMQEVDEAWPVITKLLADKKTPKPLLLEAFDAAASIRPKEAGPLLLPWCDSKDEEIAEAATDARLEAETFGQEMDDLDFDFGDEDDDEEEPEGGPISNAHVN